MCPHKFVHFGLIDEQDIYPSGQQFSEILIDSADAFSFQFVSSADVFEIGAVIVSGYCSDCVWLKVGKAVPFKLRMPV